MTYRLNMFRWRLARLIAPAPVVAAPLGGARAYIFLRDNGLASWIETTSINVEMSNHLRPLMGDEMALATTIGPKGTFSGTIGDKA